MKDLSTFVWCLIGAVLYFGVWALAALALWAIALVLIGIFKPEWLDKM